MAELFMLVGVIVTVLLMIACWLEVRAQHSNDGATGADGPSDAYHT